MSNYIRSIDSVLNGSGEDCSYFATVEEIKKTLFSINDAAIVFDKNGDLVLLNEAASRYFLRNHQSFQPTLALKAIPFQNLTHKRLLNKITRRFKETFKGIPRQFNWVEEHDKRPIKAFNIILNRISLENESMVIATLVDITQSKVLEWVLWSLAEISNHSTINEVIDEILKLACKVFHAQHSCVDLLDSTDIAHTVSYFSHGIKQENISYSLTGTPCHEVKKSRNMHCYNGDVQIQFPDDHYLKHLGVISYIGGPLINSEGILIGLFILMSENKIVTNSHHKTLFKLFSDRINLEIERLLALRKLQFLASISQQDPNPVFRIQSDGNILYTNSSGKQLVNYWGAKANSIPDKLQKACRIARKSREIVRVEIEVNQKIYLFALSWIEDFDQVNIYATDITELKLAQQKMRDLAHYDTLTNVANRQYFDTALSEWIEQAKKNKKELALLLVDIDNFKTINDTLGHHVGDRLLRNLAKRIAGCLRKEDFIARLGGDEFVVLLKLKDNTDIEKIAFKINQALSSPFEFGDYHLETTCSIGISYFPSGGSTSSELLRNADIAMYRAKNSGKNQYAIYSNEHYDEVNSRLILLKKDLKSATAKNEFYIDYQPQFDLQSQKIIGFESFLRWRHPKKGLISPTEFIPLAEQTGVIHSLGYWGIEQTLKDYASFIKPACNGTIAINVGLLQLNDQHFIDNICEKVIQSNIPHKSVILEISEHISSNRYRHLNTNLETLYAEGIQLSLDNFGSGSPNLMRLLELPVNYVKIDHNLLHTLYEKPKQGAFISGLIELAKKLELLVIQKGVENEEQSKILKQLGCHIAQGFYYCRPLSINALETFIDQYLREYHK